MEFLERSRPPHDAVLIMHATFTRFGIGEPHLTPELFWAAQPPEHVKVLSVDTNGELAIVSLSIAVDPDWPVELAVAYAKLMYGKALSEQMFGEDQAMRTPATYISSPFAKAQWQGTADWDFVRISTEPEGPTPEPILN